MFFNIRCVFSTIRALMRWPHIISVKKGRCTQCSFHFDFSFFLFSFSLSPSFFSFCHCWWEGQIALATYKANDKVFNISLSNSTAFIETTANPYLMTWKCNFLTTFYVQIPVFHSNVENLQIPCSRSKLQLAFSVGNPAETALLPLRRTRPGTCYWVAAGLLVAAKIVGNTARDQCASGILVLERRSSGYERHQEEHYLHLYISTQNTLFR